MEIAHPTETMATAAAVAAPVMVDLASPPPPLTSALPCRELTTEPDLRRKLPTVDTVGASLASACKMPSDDVSKGAAAGCNVAPLANIDFDAHAGSRNGRVPVVATPTASLLRRSITSAKDCHVRAGTVGDCPTLSNTRVVHQEAVRTIRKQEQNIRLTRFVVSLLIKT
eukprot:TRINITY_DN26068_c1_g1_i8.p1 TRINITY_DN26068_c1_g1~~TRINITY_DN26068_c1_g1_i8.p1  ORF type:complete len:169 (+),score=16.66 TRINITY_DN26068_c1_g1_i8:329-835(+)